MLIEVKKKILAKENFAAKLLRPKKAKRKSFLVSILPPFFKYRAGMSHPLEKDWASVFRLIYPNTRADRNELCEIAAGAIHHYFYFVPDEILERAIWGMGGSYAPEDGALGIVKMLRTKLLFEFGIDEEWDWDKAMQLGLKSLNNGKDFSPQFLEALENLKETDKKKYLG